MPKDPYANNLFTKDIYHAKRDVAGSLVVVLDSMQDKRELDLIVPPTRAVCKYQIHELVMTDDPQAAPGRKVDPVSYLGFVEVEEGGVLKRGDSVWMDGRQIGVIAGFDETHCPNHINVVIRCAHRSPGPEMGAKVGSRMLFCKE